MSHLELQPLQSVEYTTTRMNKVTGTHDSQKLDRCWLGDFKEKGNLPGNLHSVEFFTYHDVAQVDGRAD